MSDEHNDDPMAQHLENITKKVERIVNGRMQSLAEQFVTVVNDIEELRHKLNSLESVINLHVKNNLYMTQTTNVLSMELDALEHYLANTDPVLKKLLDDAKERQTREKIKRQQDG